MSFTSRVGQSSLHLSCLENISKNALSFKHRKRFVRFVLYSLGGSVFWISFFVFGGFYFGNVPLVKKNLTAFIFLIIFVSILPGVIEYLRSRAR